MQSPDQLTAEQVDHWTPLRRAPTPTRVSGSAEEDLLGQLECPHCRQVDMIHVVPEKNRDSVDDAVCVTVGALQLRAEQLHRFVVTGTNQILEQPTIDRHRKCVGRLPCLAGSMISWHSWTQPRKA